MRKFIYFVSLFTSIATLASKMPHSEMTYFPMEVSGAKYGFTSVSSDVKISVTDSGSGLPAMSLEYLQNDDLVFVTLEVYETRTDGCGSTHYFARRPGREIASRPLSGFRYNVELTDHTTRRCRDLQPYLWVAEVRSGFGWCGTGDAEMSLRGKPTHPIY